MAELVREKWGCNNDKAIQRRACSGSKEDETEACKILGWTDEVGKSRIGWLIWLDHVQPVIYRSRDHDIIYSAHKSTCTYSNLLDVGVIAMFCLTIWVDLLSMHSVYSLSSKLLSLFAFVAWATSSVGCVFGRLMMWGSESVSRSDISELSELMVISIGSYPLSFILKLILSTSLAVLMTRALLTFARHQYQGRICLFWLTKCVGRPRFIVTIIFWLMIAIALLRCAKLSTKRFLSLLASVMISSFLIKVIVLGLLWYVILLS